MKGALIKWGTALLTGGLLLVNASTGMAVTQNVDASAVVTAATLQLTPVADLDFGSIIASDSVSTVTIDASSGGGVTPSVTSGTAAVSGGANGEVTVQSNISATVSITYTLTGDTNSQANELDNASDAMTVSNIGTLSTGPNLTLTAATPSSIYIGGALAVDANQAEGTYEGTIVVEVLY